MKKLSRYEQNKGVAYCQMQHAIQDEGAYVEIDDYVVTTRNKSSNYSLHVTVTNDRSFANYMYDLERCVAKESVEDSTTEGDTYVVTLSHCSGYIYDILSYEIIK